MAKKINHKDISPEILQAIGYIAIVAGNIEHFLEDTILTIAREHVEGVRPSTDLMGVSKLVARFKAQADDFASARLKRIAQDWCTIALDAFICRNAILHGRSMIWNEDSLDFNTNTRYNLEIRKLSSQTFIASAHTAQLLAGIFELLAHIITGFMLFERCKISEQQFIDAVSLNKLENAISTIHELANLVDYYNREKY